MSQTKAQPGSELEIIREFDAPLEALWRAWTEPGQLMRWWGPKGFTAPSCTMDFRVGGKYLYCMRSPEGDDYWSTGIYEEIVPQERIVCTDSFSDANGNIIPAAQYGMEGDWPDAMRVTLRFESLGGRSRMTLHHAGIPEGQMRDMTREGWSGSFDKLATVLTNK